MKKVNWTVKIRVTRMWVSVNVGGLIMRHNMILLDCEVGYNLDFNVLIGSYIVILSHFFVLQNRLMHVVVTPALWIQFQNLISEGSLYVITRPDPELCGALGQKIN